MERQSFWKFNHVVLITATALYTRLLITKLKIRAQRKNQAMKARRGSRAIAIVFLYPRHQMGRVANATPRQLYSRERGPLPVLREAGLAPGPVWTGAEKLVLAWIRSPERLARSKSLYRLSYPDPRKRIRPWFLVGHLGLWKAWRGRYKRDAIPEVWGCHSSGYEDSGLMV